MNLRRESLARRGLACDVRGAADIEAFYGPVAALPDGRVEVRKSDLGQDEGEAVGRDPAAFADAVGDVVLP